MRGARAGRLVATTAAVPAALLLVGILVVTLAIAGEGRQAVGCAAPRLIAEAPGWADDPAVVGPSPTSAAELDAYIASAEPRSPLIGLGAVFVREGEANGVDPRALVAIAGAESSFGTAGGALEHRNAFGWGPHRRFSSWEEGIAAVAAGLRRGYLKRGLLTIGRIGARYAPEGAANDPSGLNSYWVSNVGTHYSRLGGDPDGTIALSAAGSGSGPADAACDGDDDERALRGRIVSILREELALGLRETSENCGPALDRYWPGACGARQEWCAVFATWVWRRAGVEIPLLPYSGGIGFWAIERSSWKAGIDPTPQPGDAVLYGRALPAPGTSHVDIVEEVLPGGRIVVIGGNVADSVSRKSAFDPLTSRVLGFASPVPSG